MASAESPSGIINRAVLIDPQNAEFVSRSAQALAGLLGLSGLCDALHTLQCRCGGINASVALMTSAETPWRSRDEDHPADVMSYCVRGSCSRCAEAVAGEGLSRAGRQGGAGRHRREKPHGATQRATLQRLLDGRPTVGSATFGLRGCRTTKASSEIAPAGRGRALSSASPTPTRSREATITLVTSAPPPVRGFCLATPRRLHHVPAPPGLRAGCSPAAARPDCSRFGEIRHFVTAITGGGWVLCEVNHLSHGMEGQSNA